MVASVRAIFDAFFHGVEADLASISGLHFDLDAVQARLELLVRAGVEHLAPHLSSVWGPFSVQAHNTSHKQSIGALLFK